MLSIVLTSFWRETFYGFLDSFNIKIVSDYWLRRFRLKFLCGSLFYFYNRQSFFIFTCYLGIFRSTLKRNIVAYCCSVKSLVFPDRTDRFPSLLPCESNGHQKYQALTDGVYTAYFFWNKKKKSLFAVKFLRCDRTIGCEKLLIYRIHLLWIRLYRRQYTV